MKKRDLITVRGSVRREALETFKDGRGGSMPVYQPPSAGKTETAGLVLVEIRELPAGSTADGGRPRKPKVPAAGAAVEKV